MRRIFWAAGGAAMVGLTAMAFSGLTSGPGAAQGRLAYKDADTVARGARLYVENCATCHGENLEGEANWRQRDADGYLPAPPHDVTGHTWHHPDDQLIAITALGTEKIVGGGYKSRMPGFADSLTEDDILAVLAYIKSTWPQEVIDQHNQINAQSGN